MNTSASQAIHSNAQYHSDLINTLHSLEYAPSALKEQTRYIADLRTQLKEVKERVDKLTSKTKKERKEHEEMRDSLVRRMASTVVGKKEKFQAKKAKEEREYIEALEAEMRERENQKMLDDMLVEATRTKFDLEEKAERLKLVQAEISNLYENIFGGPTQEFPRDDQLENQLKSAQETYNTIQALLNSNSRSVGLLVQADQMMRFCLDHMNEALGYSTWDVYGGGSLTDMMERNALSNAAITASKAEMLVTSARRACPQVQDIPPLKVHAISMIGDVFFDNIFSDLQAHRRIESNKQELMRAQICLKSELRAAKSRVQQIGADLMEASEVLIECRKELERFRRETFERVGSIPVSSTSTSDNPESDSLPPSYESSADGGAAPVYSPPAGPPPLGHPDISASIGTSVYRPPLGPPPGHLEGHTTPGTDSIVMPTPSLSDSDPSTSTLLSAINAQTQIYTPPPGPPPGHLELPLSSSSTSHIPAIFQPKVHARTPSTGSNTDLLALPTESASSTSAVPATTDSSQTVSPSSPTSSRVPAHWGSRNPFAASIMKEYDDDHAPGGGEKNGAGRTQ